MGTPPLASHKGSGGGGGEVAVAARGWWVAGVVAAEVWVADVGVAVAAADMALASCTAAPR